MGSRRVCRRARCAACPGAVGKAKEATLCASQVGGKAHSLPPLPLPLLHLRLRPPPAGANMVNSWLMRPGRSTVEITPFEFGYMGGSFGLSNRNAMVGGRARGPNVTQRMLGPPVLLLLRRLPLRAALMRCSFASHVSLPHRCRTTLPSCCGGMLWFATPPSPPLAPTSWLAGSLPAGGPATAVSACPGRRCRQSWSRLWRWEATDGATFRSSFCREHTASMWGRRGCCPAAPMSPASPPPRRTPPAGPKFPPIWR